MKDEKLKVFNKKNLTTRPFNECIIIADWLIKNPLKNIKYRKIASDFTSLTHGGVRYYAEGEAKDILMLKSVDLNGLVKLYEEYFSKDYPDIVTRHKLENK